MLRSLLSSLVPSASSPENPAVPLTSTGLVDWLDGGSRSHAGASVSEKTSLGMPAVWRAVSLISGSAAGLPLHAYVADGEVRERVGPTSAAASLLRSPHQDLTPFELWEQVYVHLLLWGNAYLRVWRDRIGRPRELALIHPSRVRAGRESATSRKVYEVDGTGEPWYDDRILHIPGLGYDGIAGVSPIRIARQGIGLALAAEEYGARLFGSGSLMSGILQTEQRLDQASADALKTRWRAKTSGLSGAHEVAVLDRGIKFQPLSMPPEDAQFLESRRFQVAEVARLFGVPPHMLGDTERSTSWGAGIEQQSIGYVVYTLRPWLTRVEQRVSKLFGDRVYARYTVEGLLRGDSAQRAAYYQQMWSLGVLSTNEIRALEDQAGVGPDGDVRYRPLNMGVLGETDEQQEGDPDAG
ncbi:MAG: phage portal protein [Phycicoccus sp.]